MADKDRQKSMQKFIGNDFLADRIEGETPIMEIRPMR
jgi:hypothetical protein